MNSCRPQPPCACTHACVDSQVISGRLHAQEGAGRSREEQGAGGRSREQQGGAGRSKEQRGGAGSRELAGVHSVKFEP